MIKPCQISSFIPIFSTILFFSLPGIRPDDVDVIELHDCFSANELITYEALGLCDPGKGFCQVKKNPKIREKLGRGCVG